jgi:hypothetical protein
LYGERDNMAYAALSRFFFSSILSVSPLGAHRYIQAQE